MNKALPWVAKVRVDPKWLWTRTEFGAATQGRSQNGVNTEYCIIECFQKLWWVVYSIAVGIVEEGRRTSMTKRWLYPLLYLGSTNPEDVNHQKLYTTQTSVESQTRHGRLE